MRKHERRVINVARVQRALECRDMSPRSKSPPSKPIIVYPCPFVVLQEMKISLNGESVDIRETKTLAELVDRYQLPPQSIVVEHNGLAVHRHEWSQRRLTEGDRIEFVRVVAGG